ncbi:hypothetical protein D9M71_744630 [compost metagenome]
MSHRLRRPSRKPGAGGTQFMLPATGSTMMHATSWPTSARVFSTAAMSLNGRVRVCLAKAAGTPGEFGTPKVRAPEPAFTSRLSEWPW